MQIAAKKVVTFDYTLKDPQGQVIDSSGGRAPLTYLHGVGGIIPGLEAALLGKASGDNVVVTIAPADAYGERDQRMVGSVPRTQFQGVANIQAGMQFQAQTPQGPRIVTVVAVDDQNVTVDANHPLAGVTLNFNVDIREVRDATEEELQHGHAHGAGGHHHHEH